ncbi:MAG TPA: CPBP family intramembrane glutamic endopeptidase [Steroidobacteraceae bacterium]|nr:CPBP family intramembrane glutamic endopeptidase [Steroidobacteraceae bacterium]
MRALAAFVGVILLAGLIGAALSYPAYELTSTFAAWPFHRVASRIAMLVLLIGLIWLCRRLGLGRKRDFGFGLPWPRFLRTAILFGALGVATAALGAGFLLESRLRIADPSFPGTLSSLIRIFLVGLASGVSVALIEETVFRGAIHTAVEREAGPWAAVLSTAPLFAVLHFFARIHIPADQVNAGSGFYLLVHSFQPLSQPALVLDAFLSWLAVGLTLSLTRVLTGNTAAAIGLHAGWVIVLRMLQESTLAAPDAGASIWVSRLDGLLGYWIIPWSIVIAAALWLGRRAWVPGARTDPAGNAQPAVSGASRSSR